ncbi:unnamed protein product [Ectocarpus fasciculatus]
MPIRVQTPPHTQHRHRFRLSNNGAGRNPRHTTPRQPILACSSPNARATNITLHSRGGGVGGLLRHATYGQQGVRSSSSSSTAQRHYTRKPETLLQPYTRRTSR